MGEEIEYVIVWNRETSEVRDDISENELDTFLKSDEGKGFKLVWQHNKKGVKRNV
ncbi:hypothetical protein KAT95_01580 [Candidatus Parcubacteria bacterium]|nr:hypothetical protein [Candidatus Parcubacteria bacterium]